MGTPQTGTPINYTRDVLEAVRRNDLQATKRLLMNRVDINATDANKRSLLLIATSNANYEMAMLLV